MKSHNQEPIRKPQKYKRREPKNKPGFYEGLGLNSYLAANQRIKRRRSKWTGDKYSWQKNKPNKWRPHPEPLKGSHKRRWRNAIKDGLKPGSIDKFFSRRRKRFKKYCIANNLKV